MAPIPPKRSSSQKPRTKLPKSARPASQSIFTRATTTQDTPTSSDTAASALNARPLSSHSALPSSKRDKRQIKHSLLLSRLKGNRPGSSAHKIQKKRARERENKRGKTQLSSRLKDLADALPQEESKGNADVRVRPARSSMSNAAVGSDAVGLRTKKGHTRRLQKLKELERERFGRNLEVMGRGADGDTGGDAQGGKEAGGQVGPGIGGSTGIGEQSQHVHTNRWEALRVHISRQQAAMDVTKF